ncbi:unnamed protein product [Mycena citricolor]|uniref:Uncharacterized protein n=1 Tax=Mycena citricolor TaxID=2018698 RepID=A0AAD2HNQ0_9AGAR|nr:unnamed protein product [Mycena citricolor]
MPAGKLDNRESATAVMENLKAQQRLVASRGSRSDSSLRNKAIPPSFPSPVRGPIVTSRGRYERDVDPTFVSLRKLKDDEWTSSGFKSTLALHFLDGSSPSRADESPLCGLGWHFRCTSWPAIDGSGSPQTRVSVSFLPGLVAGAAYGRVTFDVEYENLIADHDASRTAAYLRLPCSRDSSAALGAFYRRREAQDVPVVAITVRLPESLGLQVPQPRPAGGGVNDVVLDALAGAETVDLKFYAYTLRSADGSAVSRPKPLYAKMSALRGYSVALDTFLSGFSGDGFSESKLVDLDARDLEIDETFDEYDYMSDSDLENDVRVGVDTLTRKKYWSTIPQILYPLSCTQYIAVQAELWPLGSPYRASNVHKKSESYMLT